MSLLAALNPHSISFVLFALLACGFAVAVVMTVVIVVMLEPNQRRLTAIVSLGPRSVLVAGRVGVARRTSPPSDARLPDQNSVQCKQM